MRDGPDIKLAGYPVMMRIMEVLTENRLFNDLLFSFDVKLVNMKLALSLRKQIFNL